MMDLRVDIFDEQGNTLIKTLEPISFSLDGQTITIPAGFISDGASVPRFLWCILDPPICALTLIPSIIHDFLYRDQPCYKIKTDWLYFCLLRDNGYALWKCWLVFVGLVLFGWLAWFQHKFSKRRN